MSAPWVGFAPGAKGTPLFLPSGVAPVALPYTTLDVIVKIDKVGLAFLYRGYFFNSL